MKLHIPAPRTSSTLGAAAVALLLAGTLSPAPARAQASAQEPVVYAVLFYSPTCPHCHTVINQHLPPLRERFGDQITGVGVDETTPGGSALYDAAVAHYDLAPDRLGVPLMVVGDVTLLGSQEIPDRLPGLIEEGLRDGGTPWPAFPELREALAAQGLVPEEPAPAAVEPPGESTTGRTAEPAPAEAEDAPASVPDVPPAAATPGALTPSLPTDDLAQVSTATQRFLRDPVANGLAVVVLLALVATLAVGVLGLRPTAPTLPDFPRWTTPLLAAVGLGIAAYLATVEVTGATAVCGPVGDCNTVQQSEFSSFLGVPVGVLGMLGYLVIAVGWALRTFGPTASRQAAGAALWAVAFLGTAFSAYLTFLEPFVIGATCVWCISSALVMALLLLASTHELRRLT